MKKYFMLCACLLCGLAFFSCDNNKPGKPQSTVGKASVFLAVDMSPYAQNGYIVPLKDLSAGTVSFTNAMEVKNNPYLVRYKDWLFYVPGSSDGTVIKYSRTSDGNLQKEGQLAVSSATAMCASVAFASDTKAYASAPGDNKIVIFNPQNMSKTGEINLADSRWGVNGSNTPGPLGLIIRDNKLYVGCGEFDQMPVTKPGAYVLIIDDQTDQPIKMIHDSRLSSASTVTGGNLFMDEKNDIYVTCWGSYGYAPGQKFGLLRIKNGSDVFDPDYCFNMSDMNIAGVTGGKLQYSISNCYAGNGELYLFGYCPAYTGANGPDYIKDKALYSLKADLYNCTMSVLPLPRTNGYSTAIAQNGDDILFGLVTDANGSGVFSYNRKTGVCSQTPLISVDKGTVTDILIFNN